MFVNFIKVPFTSPLDIINYIEGFGLGVFPSGSYETAPSAVDDFSSYLTGFRCFFSGSGYWLSSGSTSQLTNYFSDNFANYLTGTYQGSTINGNVVYQGYNNPTGSSTGNLFVFTNYWDDAFCNYTTGSYSGSFLNGGATISSYSTVIGGTTGSTRNSASIIPNPAAIKNNWLISNTDGIALGVGVQPFAGANSYRSCWGSYAQIPYNTGYNLGNFTTEIWVNRAPFPSYYNNIVDTDSYGALGTVAGMRIWFPPDGNTPSNSYASAHGCQANGSGNSPSGNWYHLAMVRSTGENGSFSGVAIYYSGLLNSLSYGQQASDATGVLYSMNPLVIGTSISNPDSPTAAFSGYWTEFRLYNYARSQAEIQADMNTKISPSSTGLLLYLTF